jgi:hypothetical protein
MFGDAALDLHTGVSEQNTYYPKSRKSALCKSRKGLLIFRSRTGMFANVFIITTMQSNEDN